MNSTTWTRSRASARLLLFSVFALAVLTGIAAALGIVSFRHSHLGHDQASYVYLAREVLRGVNPCGSGLLETNPPFILWFTMIPVLLAQVLHIGVITGFPIFSIGLLAAITLWSLSLFRRLSGTRGLLFWWFAFSLVFITFDLVHNEDFGQCEHFLAVLLMPAPYEWPAVLEQGRTYGFRYIHYLPAILISGDRSPDYAPKRFSPARTSALTQLICEQTAADLRRSKPGVVFVDDCEFPRECAELHREGYANLLDWFEQNPAFGQVWSHYRIAERNRGLAVYTRVNGNE